jgi:hypothetical protein
VLSHLRRFGDDIETEELGLSRVWPKQGRQNANERGLPGAVRSEQTEDHPFWHLEVDAGKGRRRSEPLEHALDTNRGRRAVERPAGRRLQQRIHGRLLVETAAAAIRSADSLRTFRSLVAAPA